MSIKAVAFDVDGVLVRAGAFAEILEREHGLDLEATAGFFNGPFKDCLLGSGDLKNAIAPFLREWGWPGSVDDCLRVWFEADSVVNAELLNLVAAVRVRGLGCFVASTQEAYRAKYLEDVLGFSQAFDALFFSCRVGASKPDPIFFQHVTTHAGADPGEILFLDDYEPNVSGARAFGWNAEIYRWGDDVRAMFIEHGVLGDA